MSFQIHGRTRKYPQHFNRIGATVSLAGHEAIKPAKVQIKKTITNNQKSKTTKVLNKDEHYVLDLCDKVLGLTCSHQHRFDFLLGDTNLKGIATRLPVDGYYEEINLAIEYCERQHTEVLNFFDKPDRITISGVHRGEQRKIYDERRRNVLPKNGITLIEFSYTDFNHDKQKRIIRDPKTDEDYVKKMLKAFFTENSIC